MLSRVRALPLLLLLGCAAAGDVAPGFEVRLVARTSYALGRPMPLALEAVNRGPREITFDAQGLGHSPYEVRTAEGRRVAFVDWRAGGLGTVQNFVSIQPGQTIVLDEIDLAERFAILDPGDYVARFAGMPRWGLEGWTHEGPADAVLTAVPESDPLRFRVGDGPLSPRDRRLLALLPALPEGWILFKDGEGLTFMKSKVEGTSLRAFATLQGSMLSPLRLSGKADRAPGDDAIEAELNRTNPLPRLIAETLR